MYEDFKNNQKIKEKKELKIREDQIKKDLDKIKVKDRDIKVKEEDLKKKEDILKVKDNDYHSYKTKDKIRKNVKN